MLDYNTNLDQSATSPAIVPLQRGLHLMPEQFNELKAGLDDVKDKLSALIILQEVGQKDHDSYEQAIKRAFVRIEKLEERVEQMRDKQLSNSWMTHVATAALTGLGAALAAVIINGGA